jgi:hypothetical protein
MMSHLPKAFLLDIRGRSHHDPPGGLKLEADVTNESMI